MYKKSVILLFAMMLGLTASAQWRDFGGEDTARFSYRLSMGTMVTSGYGRTAGLSWVAPRVAFRPTDRLTLRGGFAVAGSLTGGYAIQGRGPQTISLRRTPTQLTAFHAGAEYRIDDRLKVWASVAHVDGWVTPLWTDLAMPVDATAFSGGFQYRFDSGSAFEMHVTVIRDHAGSLPALFYDRPCLGCMYDSFMF